MRAIAALVVAALTGSVVALAQAPARRPSAPSPPARRAAPPPVAPTVAPGDVTCPTPLGSGVNSKIVFCDVLSSRVPSDGVLVKLPPHRGNVTLTFDLHNRHTYSEEQVK